METANISDFDKCYIKLPYSNTTPRRGLLEISKSKSQVIVPGILNRINLLNVRSLNSIQDLRLDFSNDGIHIIQIVKRSMRDDFGKPLILDLDVIGKSVSLMPYRSMFMAYSDCYIYLTIQAETEGSVRLYVELV